MQGFIALYRCLLDKPIWKNSTPEQKTILITLLLMVNHEAKEWEWKGEKFRAEPGQTITSLEKITEDCGKGISIRNVRTALARFEKLEFLTNESTKTGRLITILNWGLYQLDYKKTDKETDKDPTNNRQTHDKDLTPNNNDNNDNHYNNDNKSIYTPKKSTKKKPKEEVVKKEYAENVLMTETEYNKLIEKHGEILTKKMIDTLSNYKCASGKKYVNDYKAILTWVEEKVLKEVSKGVQNGSGRTDNQANKGKFSGLKIPTKEYDDTGTDGLI